MTHEICNWHNEIVNDERTEQQRDELTYCLFFHDRYLSHHPPACPGVSIAVFACKPEDKELMTRWLMDTHSKSATKAGIRELPNCRMTTRQDDRVTIYAVDEGHPALLSKQDDGGDTDG